MTNTPPRTRQTATGRGILRPDDTCWQIATAGQVAVILDAADYFVILRDAIRKAQHNVLLIGWDIDTRIKLDPTTTQTGTDTEIHGPNKLGRFLRFVARKNPSLEIHILKWSLGVMLALRPGSTAFDMLGWILHPRVHFKMDSAHPAAAAHHQKVVVIDDAIAFCGGIDMLADRWDTSEHLDENPLRRRPTTNRPYGPWHDVTMVVSGDAAKALGDLARDRWQRATGEVLTPPPPVDPHWPKGLAPLAQNAPLAISRTMPALNGHPAVHEIEALYLAVIAATRRTLYIESQYFASRKIAEAMATRLREDDGPEIVLINPQSADGWLEEAIMGSSRARLLHLIDQADSHGRFRMYTPVTTLRNPIYVHAKVLVMDDRLLRVGSSNLNNRSMGFDTECDLTLEADPADDGLRTRITGLRNHLLAEHLNVTDAEVVGAIKAQGGSLIAAIEALRSEGRSLTPFERPTLTEAEANVLAENELFDPERPSRRNRALHLSRWLPWVRNRT